MASSSTSESTSRRSSVRSGFVYGLTDANWFGVVLNSPTEWSAPEMHFPDVSHTEEYDARQQRVQSVEAPTSTTSSSNSSPANSPHSMSGQVAATRTASSSSRGRNSAVHSLPHTQDPKVIDWLEKVSSKK